MNGGLPARCLGREKPRARRVRLPIIVPDGPRRPPKKRWRQVSSGNYPQAYARILRISAQANGRDLKKREYAYKNLSGRAYPSITGTE
jgi:hypothetical protein